MSAIWTKIGLKNSVQGSNWILRSKQARFHWT